MESLNLNSSKRLKALELISDFKELPLEVFVYDILSYLNARDILSLCSISRYFKEICSVGDKGNSIIWTALYRADFAFENKIGDEYFGSNKEYINELSKLIDKEIIVTLFPNQLPNNELDETDPYLNTLNFRIVYSSDALIKQFSLRKPYYSTYNSYEPSTLQKSKKLISINLLFVIERTQEEGYKKNLLPIHVINIDSKEISNEENITIIEKNNVLIGVNINEYGYDFGYFWFKNGFLTEKISNLIMNPEERKKQFKKLDFVGEIYKSLKSKNITNDIQMDLKPYLRIEAYDNIIISRDTKSQDFIIVDKKTGNPFCFHKHSLSDITYHFEDENVCFNKICPKCNY